MPAFGQFKARDDFYTTAFHELTHYAAFRIMPRRRVFLRTGEQHRRGMSA
jgi:antirestriction protein ArdC